MRCGVPSDSSLMLASMSLAGHISRQSTDDLLGDGMLPLDVLEKKMMEWVEEVRSKKLEVGISE